MRRSRKYLPSTLSVEEVHSLPSEIRFLSFHQEVHLQLSFDQGLTNEDNNNDLQNHKQFTSIERQNLKNAFRYICRLAFKESSKYINQINAIIRRITKGEDVNHDSKIKDLLKDAEVISGQRYFKQYLSNLSIADQRIVIEYMKWFLQRKYLRYLRPTENEKGKRKNMKKQLYLRFKNQVMLPYLFNHMKGIERMQMAK